LAQILAVAMSLQAQRLVHGEGFPHRGRAGQWEGGRVDDGRFDVGRGRGSGAWSDSGSSLLHWALSRIEGGVVGCLALPGLCVLHKCA
jgi:hypothetical protein